MRFKLYSLISRRARRGNRRRKRHLFSGFESLERRWMLDGAGLVDAPEFAEGEGAGSPVADFSLVDVNPNSATFDQPVSPRDYLNSVSAWYFGHAP